MTVPYSRLKWADGTSRVPDDGIATELWVQSKSAAGVITILLWVILATGLLCSAGYIVYDRDSPVIRLATPWSLILIILGMLFLLSSAFSWVGRPSAFICNMRNWLFFLGNSLIFASLTAKSARVYYIFHNAQRFKPVMVKTWKVLLGTLILMIPMLLLLILNSSLSPTHDVRLLSSDKSHVDVFCTNNTSTWIYLCFTYVAMLLLASLVFAFKNRNVPSGFNETRQIFIAEYIVAAIAVVGTITSTLSHRSSPIIAIVFSIVPIIIGIIVLWVLFFGPKFYISLFRPDINNGALMAAKRGEKYDSQREHSMF